MNLIKDLTAVDVLAGVMNTDINSIRKNKK